VPRSQTGFGRDILKLNLWRRSVELDVGLRFGGPFGDSHSLTEHLNGYLPAYDNEQEKTDNPAQAIHRLFLGEKGAPTMPMSLSLDIKIGGSLWSAAA
jgi:hypothetical protein